MASTWGNNTWGSNEWGDDNVTVILTRTINYIINRNSLEAFNEEGWGRQEWGNSGWGVEYAVQLTGQVNKLHHQQVLLLQKLQFR